MSKVRIVLRLINASNSWVGRIVSFAMLIMVAIICCEVGARYILNRPTIWAWDINLMFFALLTMCAGGYTLLYREHINVDVLYGRFSVRVQAIIDLFTSAFFFLFCGILVWQMAIMAFDAVKVLEQVTSQFAPPVYPLKILLVIGAILLLLQGLAKFTRDFTTAFTGREET